MSRIVLALSLMMLAAGCTEQQLAASARSACRSHPDRCSSTELPPAARAPGL